jgi:hypothetical protein
MVKNTFRYFQCDRCLEMVEASEQQHACLPGQLQIGAVASWDEAPSPNIKNFSTPGKSW